MQGRPDPALPQTFVEQQPGGAGVSPGQERGKAAEQGCVVAGKEAGCACRTNQLTLAATVSQPLALLLRERHAKCRSENQQFITYDGIFSLAGIVEQ